MTRTGLSVERDVQNGSEGLLRGRCRRLEPVRIIVVALPVAVYAWAGWQRRWVSDDGYITLRVVKQIMAGHGPVYNIGERVEVSTSTAWPWLLALAGEITRAPLPWIAVVLGLALGCLGIALSLDAGLRLVAPAGADSRPFPAGVVVILALPPFWDYASSGLETGLSLFWLGLSWCLLVRVALRVGHCAVRRSVLAAAVVVGVGELIRPDLIVVSAVFFLALLAIAPTRGRQLVPPVAIGLALPVAYQVFRMGYYGALVPNPALTKEASLARWTTGWEYFLDLATPYWLFVPALLLSWGGWLIIRRHSDSAGDSDRRTRRILFGAPVLAGLLSAAYIVRVGGDFMHGRMLLPALVCALLPVLVLPARDRVGAALLVGLAVWGGICAMTMRFPRPGQIAASGIADERGFYVKQSGNRHPVTPADYRHADNALPNSVVATVASGQRFFYFQPDQTPVGERVTFIRVPLAPNVPSPAVAMWNIGYPGYGLPLDVKVVDERGLSDPLTARFRLEHRGRPGHEKRVPPVWLQARYADRKAPPLGPSVTRAGIADVRRAETCSMLLRLAAATRTPLTPVRFLKNVVESPGLTTLRVPADPQEAAQQLCV